MMPVASQVASSSDKPVALITGAGRRVGQGLVAALAARGYRLALHANASLAAAEQAAEKLKASGTDALAVAADLRDQVATRAMVQQVHQHFGRIDAVVNSAAIWTPKPLEEVTPDDVREHFEINTLATFTICQAAGLIMVQQSTGGAIVNVGDWAIERPYPGYAAYFVSKGSIPTLTRTMAVELATRNPKVRVNAVLPGPILFPSDMTPAERQLIIEATLVKREGTVDDLAAAVILLLENSFITGVCLPVDGGRSVFSGDLRS
jgi:pteridine reductase